MTPPQRPLSAEEQRVLQGLADGYTQDQLAAQRGVGREAVSNAIVRLKRRRRCKTTVELVAAAMRAGEVT